MKKTLDLKKIHDKPEEIKQAIQENVDTTHLPKDSFSKETLTTVWKLYGAKIRETNFKAGLIVNNCGIEVKDHLVIILVENFVQQKQVEEFKEELTLFLRKQLNNYSIKVHAKINEVKETKNKVFTAQEKFEFLAKKNPTLLKLRELLQLETSH